MLLTPKIYTKVPVHHFKHSGPGIALESEVQDTHVQPYPIVLRIFQALFPGMSYCGTVWEVTVEWRDVGKTL